MSPVCELSGVRYGVGGRVLLESLDFRLDAGEKAAIIGPNGCGKSTVMRLIAALVRPEKGEVRLFGERLETKAAIRAARRRLGFLFQDCEDQFIAPTVIEDVAFSLLAEGMETEAALERANAMLERFDLAHLCDRFVLNLSGGEKKMVALAGLMATEPELLLLDEPTNALDESMQRKITEHLRSIETSMLIVSHQRDFIGDVADTVYEMKERRLVRC